MNNLVVVILAAGQGTRMKSSLPKVCHKVGNKPMINHVIDAAEELNPVEIIIVVSKSNIVRVGKDLTKADVRLKIQYEQSGTAHAVLSAVPCCNTSNDLLVLLGDVPLITPKTLKKVISTDYDAVIVGFMDTDLDNKFGRIIIKNKKVNRIVEYADATKSERKIPLSNSGMLWMRKTHVNLIYKITNNNSKGEYYLTDIVKIMVDKGLNIGFLEASKTECMGVNTKDNLAEVNAIYYNDLNLDEMY